MFQPFKAFKPSCGSKLHVQGLKSDAVSGSTFMVFQPFKIIQQAFADPISSFPVETRI